MRLPEAIDLEEQKGLRICSNVLNIAPEDIYNDMPVQVTFIPIQDALRTA